MDNQERFALAVEQYKKAQDLITHISAAATEKSAFFNEKKFREKFDCILQAIMIQVAATDGKILPAEYDFIKMLLKHKDFTTTLDRKPFAKYGWHELLAMDAAALRDTADKITKAAHKRADSFVKMFALVDIDDPRNLLNELLECVSAIVNVLFEVDGDELNSRRRVREASVAMGATIELIISLWTEYTGNGN